MTLAIVQVGAQTGDLVEEVLEHRLAVLGVQHLGVELHARQAASQVLERRDRGVRRCAPTTVKPAGASDTASPCDIQTGLLARQAVEQRRVPAGHAPASVRPNSALPVRATVPPRASAIAWKP